MIKAWSLGAAEEGFQRENLCRTHKEFPFEESDSVGSELKERTDSRETCCVYNSLGWGRGETLTLSKVWSLGWTFYSLKCSCFVTKGYQRTFNFYK